MDVKDWVVRGGVWVASIVAMVQPWKHEACYDGGDSVALAWPGRGDFVPATNEEFDRWAVVTALLAMAAPTWGESTKQATLVVAAGAWVLLHAGAAALSGVTCPPHDNRGSEIQYKAGLGAAYAAALFVSATLYIAK